jgi:hypothetical protein
VIIAVGVVAAIVNGSRLLDGGQHLGRLLSKRQDKVGHLRGTLGLGIVVVGLRLFAVL